MTSKATLTYRFVLSDEEYGRAWLREYYRRPGWRAWRVVGGPCFIMLGIAMVLGSEALTQGMGVAAIVAGVWYGLKPFLAVRMLRTDRRRRGRSDIELELRLHRSGIRIDDGKVKTEIPWEDIVRSGSGDDYVWYELSGGSRATIPLRVVDDRDALQAKLAANSTWEK